MKTIKLSEITKDERKTLLMHPAINNEDIYKIVKPILEDVKQNGINAAIKYARMYDGFTGDSLLVTEDEFTKAENTLPVDVKKALTTAAKNIELFHAKEMPSRIEVETLPGVRCSREFRPIEKVGLYIPGGSAVLPSTMLMLGIPAKLAGCRRVFACSPAKDGILNNALLYAAKIAGVSKIYKIGGAQAVGLMAYGSRNIIKADKIFGPGNQYVTAAKALVSIDPKGCAIDMPAGPSEVLIIANDKADPKFIAADLLSQAEHGNDSQVILATDSLKLAEFVKDELNKQAAQLPRQEIIKEALSNSFILVVDSLADAIEFSNDFAPEHLILNIADYESVIPKIINAGSVFLGPFSPESAGDYASGTNHSLPTYGYAKSHSGLGLEAFMKSITFQKLSVEGLNNIAPTVITIAETEKLQAHSNAVKVRLS